MITLFTSTLCERCNPTNAVNPGPPKQKTWRGWISTVHNRSACLGNTFRVYRDRESALKSRSHGDLYEVISATEFQFDSEYGYEMRRVVSKITPDNDHIAVTFA
jgi:hypothetical protein